MVYQHFMLVDPFTVAENVVLGERRSDVDLQLTRVERELRELSDRYGLGVDPRSRIWQLSVGEQQRVEILRLLYLGAKILVFDEPTTLIRIMLIFVIVVAIAAAVAMIASAVAVATVCRRANAVASSRPRSR